VAAPVASVIAGGGPALGSTSTNRSTTSAPASGRLPRLVTSTATVAVPRQA
jgi:hypothetical protein